MKDSNPSSPGDQYVTGLLNNLQPDTEYTIFVRTLTKNGQESRSLLINIHTDPFDGQGINVFQIIFSGDPSYILCASGSLFK